MSKKREEYIDQLLSDLELLKARLLSVKESDTLPFSFFSASFDRIEKISRSLHELELMQIGEMKSQMEQLVRFLSEQPKHPEPIKMAQEHNPEQEQPTLAQANPAKEPIKERIDLPEYRDPRVGVITQSTVEPNQTPAVRDEMEKTSPRSLNDTIQVSSTYLDLRKGISLNDRFLFQRELFNNDRSVMNSVMDLLNTLNNFEEVESYLRKEHEWDFENPVVKEFLLVIKKGFE